MRPFQFIALFTILALLIGAADTSDRVVYQARLQAGQQLIIRQVESPEARKREQERLNRLAAAAVVVERAWVNTVELIAQDGAASQIAGTFNTVAIRGQQDGWRTAFLDARVLADAMIVLVRESDQLVVLVRMNEGDSDFIRSRPMWWAGGEVHRRSLIRTSLTGSAARDAEVIIEYADNGRTITEKQRLADDIWASPPTTRTAE